MTDILDARVYGDNDLVIRVALSNNIKKVTNLITVKFESQNGNTFENEFEGRLLFDRKNATSSVRTMRTGDKWIIALRAGDQIVFPDGIDLGTKDIFIHLTNGEMLSIPFEILLLWGLPY